MEANDNSRRQEMGASKRGAWYLVVPLRDGGERRYRSSSERAVLRRLADHEAMVRALGTESLYLDAYVRCPDGREYYKVAS